MRKINSEEVKDLMTKYGRATLHPLTTELTKLVVGETVLVEKNDWLADYPLAPLGTYLSNRRYKLGMSFSVLNVKESGWIVRRVL